MSPKRVERAAEGIRSRFAEYRRGTGLISASFALAMTLGLGDACRAQEAKVGHGAAEATTNMDEGASRDILQALQSLRASVRAEKGPESKAARPLPSRPQRKVVPPSTTTAELARLLDQYLAKTNPK